MFPILPVDLLSLQIAGPPELSAHAFNLVVNSGWNPEIGHHISRDCLNDCFNHHLSTSFKEEIVFPGIKLLCHSVSKITKLIFFASGRESGKA